ncbi:MAG: DNA topoisomerase IB [Reichenbachiella sp.]
MHEKGISRKKIILSKENEKNFTWEYYDPKGKIIKAKKTIERCDKLVLPPAWTDVWISKDKDANLQATGVDSKGRVQYRYHEKWTQAQSAKKFNGMVGFAEILPSIRKKVNIDLTLEGMPKDKVVALVVKLIDLYHFRVGNDEYAKKNKSYGLTTIKEGHMKLDRSSEAEGELDAIFEFTGKSGKLWKRRIWEDDLALLIDESGAVGGRKKTQDLFRYEDDNGLDHDIKSHHINEYLDEITSDYRKVTAKDFRTWAATWKMASRLALQLDPDTVKARKKVSADVVKTVSSDLGNTPSVCRSSYIHPVILSDWIEGSFRENWTKAKSSRKVIGLSKDETSALKYISNH